VSLLFPMLWTVDRGPWTLVENLCVIQKGSTQLKSSYASFLRRLANNFHRLKHNSWYDDCRMSAKTT
jgi:hypothetical protein